MGDCSDRIGYAITPAFNTKEAKQTVRQYFSTALLVMIVLIETHRHFSFQSLKYPLFFFTWISFINTINFILVATSRKKVLSSFEKSFDEQYSNIEMLSRGI